MKYINFTSYNGGAVPTIAAEVGVSSPTEHTYNISLFSGFGLNTSKIRFIVIEYSVCMDTTNTPTSRTLTLDTYLPDGVRTTLLNFRGYGYSDADIKGSGLIHIPVMDQSHLSLRWWTNMTSNYFPKVYNIYIKGAIVS